MEGCTALSMNYKSLELVRKSCNNINEIMSR